MPPYAIIGTNNSPFNFEEQLQTNASLQFLDLATLSFDTSISSSGDLYGCVDIITGLFLDRDGRYLYTPAALNPTSYDPETARMDMSTFDDPFAGSWEIDIAPSTMAFDLSGGAYFPDFGNELARIDIAAATFADVLAISPPGFSAPHTGGNVWCSADGATLWVWMWDDDSYDMTIAKVDRATLTVTAYIDLTAYMAAFTETVTAAFRDTGLTSNLYICSADTIVLVDLLAETVGIITPIEGHALAGIAVNPDGTVAYVADQSNLDQYAWEWHDQVLAVALPGGEVLDSYSVMEAPGNGYGSPIGLGGGLLNPGIALSPDQSQVVVLGYGYNYSSFFPDIPATTDGNKVAVIDLGTSGVTVVDIPLPPEAELVYGLQLVIGSPYAIGTWKVGLLP